MKRLICLCVAFAVLFSLSGCQKTGLSRPDFPLTAEAVAAALEETGLPGTVSEEETQSLADRYVLYMLRGEDHALTMDISSAFRDGKRLLKISYYAPSVPVGPAFAWADWKQQLVFAALLFGGFADKEEVYRAFSEQDVPAGKLPPADDARAEFVAERYQWEARLPAGSCEVAYELFNTSIENSIDNNPLNTRVLAQSPRLYITIEAAGPNEKA